ncbi:cobalamin-binding protein [Pseudomonas sp. EL_65y_Pfl2_R95]|uniref:cobalamin-binding protein n=1 Tax=Pseudomonas sp. EL_65y_Pfl2_R95 TaxID=3088698 RepID=UPI0030D7FDA0
MRRLLLPLLLALGCSAPVSAADRIVSLAPSLTEIVIDLGAQQQLVGVLDGGPRPAAVASLPSVGRYAQLEMETLLALQPDLILLWPGSISQSQRQQLQAFGIPMLVAEPHTLDTLADQFSEIGERIGRARQGHKLQQQFIKGLAALRSRYHRAQPVSVFYQVWDKPLYTLGGQQIVSDALRVCGARNVFADVSLPAPQVSIEAVLQRNPDVILASSGAQLDAWQRWSTITAVQRNQLWQVPDKGLERPSFQMLNATEQLCRVLAKAQ